MTQRVQPQMQILPPAQQRLWPELRKLTELGYVLYGGTAVALQLGHRQSVDFDLFTEKQLDKESIRKAVPWIAASTVLQEDAATYTVLADTDPATAPVKVSLFADIGFGRVGDPLTTVDGVLQVASLEDLMATKLKVLLQRVESRDYRDVAAMLVAGVRLDHGLGAARALFGPAFQPSECLKALVYFQGGDLETLTAHERATLIDAVSAVSDLPQVKVKARRLSA